MTTQPDLFDQPAAHGPGQRQTDIEALIAEREPARLIEPVATGNGPIMWVVFDRWENGRRINPGRFWTKDEALRAIKRA